MAGCCRSNRPRQTVSASGPCRGLEQKGTNIKFWVTNTGGTYTLIMQLDSTSSMINVQEFLSSQRCDGPFARMVNTNLGRIQRALALNAATFRSQVAGPTSFTKILSITDSILKDGRKYKRVSNRTSR